MVKRLPKKLKHDSITEAVFEIRFHTDDPGEVVLGRLLDAKLWRHWTRTRLPVAEFPSSVRTQEPSLRYQPLYEAKNPNSAETVKIGSNVLACHVIGKYPGWSEFYKLISKALTEVFRLSESISVTRLGLRYVNALTKDQHLISNIYDLTTTICVRDERLPAQINLNYTVPTNGAMEALVRVASPSFVSGNLPEKATAYIDVDVRTIAEPVNTNHKAVLTWVKTAHNLEKKEYFRLLPDDVIEEIREEG